MRRWRFSSKAPDPRVLCVSYRDIALVISRCGQYEFEDLIATVDAHSDILGYVPAGVARPVRDVVGLLAALDDPWPPDPAARQAFLEEHFRSGDASALIADAISVGRAVTR